MEKKKAKEFYAKLGRVWCPPLNSYVVFNTLGFRHLVRKRGIPRTSSEQERRFALLRHVEDIVAHPQSTPIHQKKTAIRLIHENGQKAISQTRADFWAFTERRGNKTIKVVIRQFKHGEKHFLSIY